MQTNIDRFLEAQNNGRYEQALAEIKNGRKESHWIWYIFPQLRGLGYSRRAQYYGIKSRDEAEDYLKNQPYVRGSKRLPTHYSFTPIKLQKPYSEALML